MKVCKNTEPMMRAFRMAEALQLRGRHREALRILQRVAKNRPRDFDICLLMGDILSSLEDYVAALKWYDRAMKRKPLDPASYFCKASTLLAQDSQADRRAAERLAKKCLALYRKSKKNDAVESDLFLGLLVDTLLQQGKYFEALETVKKEPDAKVRQWFNSIVRIRMRQARQ